MSKKNVKLESLFILSEIISPTSDREKIKQDILTDSIDWLSVVEIANTHFLTAALYYSLLDKDLLSLIDDEELLSYLEQIYTINLHRNQRIIEQSKEIAEILLKKDIKPIFLKGAASLLQNDYRDVGMRFLSDIDFCMHKDVLHKAEKLLISAGYIPHGSSEDYTFHHHLTPMYHSKWNIIIEPHKYIIAYPFSQDIDCKKAYQKSIHGTNIYILNPTFRLIHAYIHSDIININFQTMTIDLRQLYEISLIIEKYKEQIDWIFLENFFISRGLWSKFNYKLNLINELFNISTPIMKQNYRTNLHLKALYLHFKYQDTIAIYIYITYKKFINELSYTLLYRRYGISTKKEYIYFMFKRLVELIKDFNLPPRKI